MEDVAALVCALIMVALPAWIGVRSWRLRVPGRGRRAEVAEAGAQMRDLAGRLGQPASSGTSSSGTSGSVDQ